MLAQLYRDTICLIYHDIKIIQAIDVWRLIESAKDAVPQHKTRHIGFMTVHGEAEPGARPTNDISIEFEIRPKFAGLWFKIYSTDHNEILHTSQQLRCRDVCKISLWSVTYILNWSTPNFDWISNSIEISLVGRAPGHLVSQYPHLTATNKNHENSRVDKQVDTGAVYHTK